MPAAWLAYCSAVALITNLPPPLFHVISLAVLLKDGGGKNDRLREYSFYRNTREGSPGVSPSGCVKRAWTTGLSQPWPLAPVTVGLWVSAPALAR